MSANTAFVAAVIGGTGAGKSLHIKQVLRAARPARLLVWDPQDEYGGLGQVFGDRASLLAHVRARPRFAAVLRPGVKGVRSTYGPWFDWLCRLAYALGCVELVAEELGDLTQSAWAPEGWSLITRKGRHRGLRIWGTAQNPAMIDKTFFGNCTLIRCGRLNFPAHVATMAKVLGVPESELAALAPLEYVELDTTTRTLSRGRVKLPRGPRPPGHV